MRVLSFEPAPIRSVSLQRLRPWQARYMAANSSFMIADAERHFPVRIRIGVPQDGLGSRLDQIKAWLGHNCGTNGWAITPLGYTRRAERCPFDLLRRCHACECLRRPMVYPIPGRDRRGRVPSAGGIADPKRRENTTSPPAIFPAPTDVVDCGTSPKCLPLRSTTATMIRPALRGVAAVACLGVAGILGI